MRSRHRGLSEPAIRILELMLDDPAADHYGLDLGNRADVLTGTVYPLLQRLEALGWLESEPEPVDPSDAGRPRRRLYRFSPDGASKARLEIAVRHRKRSPRTRLAADPT